MELHIAAALQQPGQQFEAAMEHVFSPEQYGGREVVFSGPVHMQCSYCYDGKAVVLQGAITYMLLSHCAKCNEAYQETFRIPFMEKFIKDMAQTEEAGEEHYAFTGETIPLTQLVLDILFLHLPMQSVCSNTCKGLCPICGANLNDTQCDCVLEQAENPSPLAALETLLNDD